MFGLSHGVFYILVPGFLLVHHHSDIFGWTDGLGAGPLCRAPHPVHLPPLEWLNKNSRLLCFSDIFLVFCVRTDQLK